MTLLHEFVRLKCYISLLCCRGRDINRGCDTTCLRNALCYIATTQVGDTAQCDELLAEFDAGSLGRGDITHSSR